MSSRLRFWTVQSTAVIDMLAGIPVDFISQMCVYTHITHLRCFFIHQTGRHSPMDPCSAASLRDSRCAQRLLLLQQVRYLRHACLVLGSPARSPHRSALFLQLAHQRAGRRWPRESGGSRCCSRGCAATGDAARRSTWALELPRWGLVMGRGNGTKHKLQQPRQRQWQWEVFIALISAVASRSLRCDVVSAESPRGLAPVDRPNGALETLGDAAERTEGTRSARQQEQQCAPRGHW